MQDSGFPVHGAMDLSDGIFIDCQRFAQSAGLSLNVDLDLLPLASSVRSRGEMYAASSGEELELLVASSEELAGFTRIGTFGKPESQASAHFYLQGHEVQPETFFSHFR